MMNEILREGEELLARLNGNGHGEIRSEERRDIEAMRAWFELQFADKNARDREQLKILSATVGKFVSAQLNPLKDEIAKLKAQVAELQENGIHYRGVYQRAVAYKRGDAVTFDGSMHCAVKDVAPAQAPLTSDCWQLAVKAGRDAPRLPTTAPRRV